MLAVFQVNRAIPIMRICLLVMLAALSWPRVWAQWAEQDLAEARTYFEQLDSAALVVLHHGDTVVSWGAVEQQYNVASIRKSLLNALFGIGFDRGFIDLDSTLAELGIDDSDPPLSDQEKTARIEDLLRSRSGIVHRSLYDAGWWDQMPARDTYKPGEFWIYNNWDFNALGTIWERVSGQSIHDAFAEFIATPIGMQDFQPGDVEYQTRRNWAERMRGNTSDHRLYLFKMSARDLARFGQLYLNRGRWGEQQILSEEWIDRTFTGIPTEWESRRFFTRYGYLWWVDQAEERRFAVPGISTEAYAATGNRGHYVFIVPACELVVAHTAPTPLGASLTHQLRRRYFGSDGVQDWQFALLLERLVSAGPELSC